MNKFHQIPTDKFLPVSHENSYLFNHYDKIANFLAFNLDKNYKDILAKPVKNDLTFDWYSVYDGLIIIDKNNENDKVLTKYWGFIDIINDKIKTLSKANDENSRNWASLLTKTFNHQDNFIFSNGNDICIVWGWKFDNNDIERPIQIQNIEIPNEPTLLNGSEINPQLDEKKLDNDINEAEADESNIESKEEEFEVKEHIVSNKSNFLKFLKWIASKFWWLLWVLLILIILLFLFKSCKYDDNYNKLNSKLIQLEQKANNCCN
jgi:hypothetical protein